MAGTELRISDSELTGLKNEVLFASIALGEVSRLEDFGSALGHGGLAGRVAELSSSWDLRRGEIVAAMDTVWQALGEIDRTFDEVDGLMTSQLRKQ